MCPCYENRRKQQYRGLKIHESTRPCPRLRPTTGDQDHDYDHDHWHRQRHDHDHDYHQDHETPMVQTYRYRCSTTVYHARTTVHEDTVGTHVLAGSTDFSRTFVCVNQIGLRTVFISAFLGK